MPIYKPSELREFLESFNIRPKKGLSQNFLIDGNIIRKIAATAEVTADDVVLEIGPGPGSLTECLLSTGASVIAVEKDDTLAKALHRLNNPENKLTVYSEDILEFPLEEKLKEHLKPRQKAKVIANLPYHLTTPILIDLVTRHKQISKLVLMVQDEVARRYVAEPGTSEYGSITVFLNFFSTPKYGFQVSKNCFYPVPGVQSAVIILDLKEPPKVADQDNFFEMTRTAFQQRRKMLRGSLKELYTAEKISEALKALKINPQARPEELSLDNFLDLFRMLNE